MVLPNTNNFLTTIFKCINYIPKEIYIYAKQKHLGHKSNEKPIKSNIDRQVWPKALISAEAKKSSIKDVLNYLNDIQAIFLQV